MSLGKKISLWGGGAACVLALVAVAVWFAATHLGPAASAAGISAAWLTPDQAQETLSEQLVERQVTLTLDGTSTEVSLGDLGIRATIAQDVLDSYPWLNSGKLQLSDVTVDAERVKAVAGRVWEEFASDPQEPTIAWDASKEAFAVTAGASVRGVDSDALAAQLAEALGQDGETAIELKTVAVAPNLSDESAQDAADAATDVTKKVSVTGGDAHTQLQNVPAATVAGWIHFGADGAITYDAQALQSFADGLPAALDHEGVGPGTVVTDSAGKVLQTLTASSNSVKITSTDGLGETFSAALSEGTTALDVPAAVEVGPITSLYRHIDVDLASRVATLYENGQVVNTFPISSGKAGYRTTTGDFRVNRKYKVKTMDGRAYGPGYNYVTPDVPWVSFFHGGEALHGAPWNGSIGTADLSHGCVNMRVADAHFVYEWAPIGTEVHVHR